MNIAFIRTKADITVFAGEDRSLHALNEEALLRMKIFPRAGSSSKNIILGLQARGLVQAAEEWKFWNGPLQQIAPAGQLPVRLFPCDEGLGLEEVARHIDSAGQPDILWVEGPDFPSYLKKIFQWCPGSFKLVYSKEWRPWRIENLEQYQLCLVDEEWQIEEIKKHYPAMACAVWDKLIDYETTHYPMPVEKIYDICYVAYLRRRKNHELLFQAMAKLKERRLTCVCVGDDRKGNRAELEHLAARLRLDVHFTGEVPKQEVNRYINQSKVGVMCAVLDAAPRAILEYMAADVPVLVNAGLWAGARYVGPGAGLVKPAEEFHLGLAELLDDWQSYSPRAYLLQHYSFETVMAKFLSAVQQAGLWFRLQ